VTVFTNTGPLIALASIDSVELLQKVFGEVRVTSSVIDECDAGGSIVVPNLRSYEWLTIVEPPQVKDVHPSLLELDRGERDTIEAARAAEADLVIIDERLGRQVAERLGLTIVGSLGVLAKAKAAGFLPSFRDAAARMVRAGIRFHPDLIDRIATRVGEASA